MRTPADKDYVEKRNIGRRESDRGVCLWHDQCHETVAEMKLNCINNSKSHIEEREKMEQNMKSKLEWKVFALFVTGAVTLTIAFVFFVAPMILDMSEAVTTIKVNQRHLMHEFQIEPVKK